MRLVLDLGRTPTQRFGAVFAIKRCYRVLAIESSCDDSCVAVLERENGATRLIEQTKRTLNSIETGGIIPTKAHELHQHHLPLLAQEMVAKHGSPSLVCCTRGPGMVGSLLAGLQLAKGLAVGFGVPLVGVHHMLAHILTALMPQPNQNPPKYPFLSLLCSGGHTMLVFSKSLTEHEIIANTADIAVGDSLDKCGRELGLRGVMIGRELEKYVESIPQATKVEFESWSSETSRLNPLGFSLRMPLKGGGHKRIPEVVNFSFAGFLSSVHTYKRHNQELSNLHRQYAAYKLQEVMFDHIIDRIMIALEKYGSSGKFGQVEDLIFSGGVASNRRFREKLAQFDFNLHFPNPALCTDNAAMIGLTGVEFYEELGLQSDLSVRPIPKWPMNDLLLVEGWIER